MSKADILLKKCGFIPNEYGHKLFYVYEDDDDLELHFYEDRRYELGYQIISNISDKHYDEKKLESNAISILVVVELHQAIHEKMKELGWIV